VGTGDAGLGIGTGKKSVFFFWVRRRGRRLDTMADASMGDWTSHTENARVFRVYLRGGPILIGPVLIFWRYFTPLTIYTFFTFQTPIIDTKNTIANLTPQHTYLP
jgi:hypothetical protein